MKIILNSSELIMVILVIICTFIIISDSVPGKIRIIFSFIIYNQQKLTIFQPGPPPRMGLGEGGYLPAQCKNVLKIIYSSISECHCHRSHPSHDIIVSPSSSSGPSSPSSLASFSSQLPLVMVVVFPIIVLVTIIAIEKVTHGPSLVSSPLAPISNWLYLGFVRDSKSGVSSTIRI